MSTHERSIFDTNEALRASCHYELSENEMDLKKFTGCEHLMGGGSSYNAYGIWTNYRKTLKPYSWMSNNDLVRYKQMHRRYFRAMAGSNAGFIMIIGMLCQVGLYAWLVCSAIAHLILIVDSPPYPQYFYFIDEYYLFAILYVIYRICKFAIRYADDSFGFTFDRPSRKVLMIGKKGTIEYDFDDFIPIAYYARNTGGASACEGALVHKHSGLSISISRVSFDEAVLSWNYLNTFMDKSKPLPDLPEHEATRHLDEVTRLYDIEQGRDKNYWHKMNRNEIKEIYEEERKKAKAWISERFNELGAQEFEDRRRHQKEELMRRHPKHRKKHVNKNV